MTRTDHLLGDDPGLEDPPMFMISLVLLHGARCVPVRRGGEPNGSRILTPGVFSHMT